jgi:Ni/Fe-hydrogenase subunit HybB-like protein
MSVQTASPAILQSGLRPKREWFTPFNVISIGIMLVGAVILVLRFAFGLGAVTNLDQQFPWGIWIGFDVMAGVAFAGGAYVITFLVYIMGVEKYHPIVRVTVLNGFLAYVFYAGALLLDLGRPWNVVNPIIGNSFGLSSVLFLVAWHFMLYMIVELVEFSPAIAEWLGLKRVHRLLKGMTIGAVILGITLSTLHQSGLGALFMMAKSKIHPLWYSEFIPILFLVSSVFAGLSMVIFEGSISHRVFHDRLSPAIKRSHDGIVVGLAKICGAAMFVYLFLHVINFVHGQLWQHASGGYFAWYLTELIGFVALPMVLFLTAAAHGSGGLIRIASLLTPGPVKTTPQNPQEVRDHGFHADEGRRVPDHPRLPGRPGTVLVPDVPARSETQSREGGSPGAARRRPVLVLVARGFPLPPRAHVGASRRRRHDPGGNGRLRPAAARSSGCSGAAGGRYAARGRSPGLDDPDRREHRRSAVSGRWRRDRGQSGRQDVARGSLPRSLRERLASEGAHRAARPGAQEPDALGSRP